MTCHFNEVFSYANAIACLELIPPLQRSSVAVVLMLPDSHDPLERTRNVLYGKIKSLRQSVRNAVNIVFGLIRCRDYQTLEGIIHRQHEKDVTPWLLMGKCLKQSGPTVLPWGTLAILRICIDTEAFVQRGCRLPSMSWARRMWEIASKEHLLSVTGIYFSVLGGAYSSLSKANASYAHQAGQLAIRQIRLAQQLKDPVLECKCWLYFAEDLIQLGRLRKAKQIMTHQYQFAQHLQDNILLSMCDSVSLKWQTMYDSMRARR